VQIVSQVKAALVFGGIGAWLAYEFADAVLKHWR
jgi:hypothetical protein